VQQRGLQQQTGRQVIVPFTKFVCNGRITGVIASMARLRNGLTDPYLEVWHPRTPGVYDKISEVQLVESEVVQVGYDLSTAYWFVNITLNDFDKIEFETGDVIGYYHPNDSRYLILSIETAGYTIYANESANASSTISLDNQNIVRNNRQPLIQFTIGMNNHACNAIVCIVAKLM